MELPDTYHYEISEVYSDTEVHLELKGKTLRYYPADNQKAVAVLLTERQG